MEYLHKVLGIKTKIISIFEDFPNFIKSRYTIKYVLLDDMPHLFIYPTFQIEDVKTLKIHLALIKEKYNYQQVIILDRITSRLKDYLIRERISFVVDNKQIYLPFLGTYLKEKCDAEVKEANKMLPSSQMLLFYLLYCDKNEITTSKASIDLNLTPTSISRASKQLESLNLVKVRRVGVQKIIFYEGNPKSLFEKAEKYLENPIKKVVYVPNNICKDNLLESNVTALAKHSLISESSIIYYATNSIEKWKDIMTEKLIDSDYQIAIEQWRYDPRRLSKSSVVDILSLALSLKESNNERIEDEVSKMLDDYWENKNGKRNRVF